MRELLLCPPDYYSIEYEINPWMSRARGAETELVKLQWQALHQMLSSLGSKIQLHRAVAEMLGCLVISVELVDPRFYHLDTCFCPLPDGGVFWFPEAFDEYGQRAIRAHVNDLIDVEEEEAKYFSCNAVVLERDIVLPEGPRNLIKALTGRGYQCHELPMSEFMKAGGACKCLTMFLPQRDRV